MAKQNEISVFSQIEKEIPLIIAKATKSSADFLKDDKSLANALKIGYEFLPIFIRLVISEEKFVAFCMKNKTRLFPKTTTKKTITKPVKKDTKKLTAKVVSTKIVTTKPPTKSVVSKPQTKSATTKTVAKPTTPKSKTTLKKT